MTDEPLISMESVQVYFTSGGFWSRLRGTQETVNAVDGVSLDIQENEVVTLVGESGCGKTTLGKTAVALQRPTAGTVKYRGQDIWEAKEGEGQIPYSDIRRALQIIHQDPGSSLNPNRTVLNSLLVPLKRWFPDMNPVEREARVYSLLERVGMTPAESYANRYPHQLSGGEKQRVVLGRALLMEPDVILADEAISALDVSLRVEMMDLMHELQDLFDTSFLFISHDIANARYFTEKVGGRIGIMYLGRLVEIGPADEVIHDPRHPYTEVLRWATPTVDPELMEASDPTRMPVRAIDIPDPINPPPGCHFHTRCIHARELCTRVDPRLVFGDPGHPFACFRGDGGHEYWESDELADERTTPPPAE